MKRWTLRILLCLILLTGGAITTVAVAWGGMRVDLQLDTVQYNENEATRRLWMEFGESLEFAGVAGDPNARSVYGGITTYICKSQRWMIGIGPQGESWFREDDFVGIPFRALYGGVRGTNSSLELMNAIATAGFGSKGYDRFFPLRPIWPGFLLNTLFYAAIWFGVFFGFASAKRAIRRKRGRCPRCGYDLRGHRHEGTEPRRHEGLEAGCPECGWGRSQ